MTPFKKDPYPRRNEAGQLQALSEYEWDHVRTWAARLDTFHHLPDTDFDRLINWCLHGTARRPKTIPLTHDLRTTLRTIVKAIQTKRADDNDRPTTPAEYFKR